MEQAECSRKGCSVNIIKSLHTALGDLKISESPFSSGDYPGYALSIQIDNEEYEFALIEVDNQTEELKIHIWDGYQDDPCFTLNQNKERIIGGEFR